ncbi:MAG TPA: uridine kinase [Chloroflexota bacterium]|nr:uridine kinase [Chloroflexota bacterium]
MTQSASRPVFVAITGGSATGKTTLARALAAALSDLTPVVVNQDRYFRDFAEYTPDERERVRTANHPDALNWPAFHAALDLLLSGQSTMEPAAGTRAKQRGDAVQPVGPGRVLIVEGLFALWDTRCREAADLRLYTEIDDDERVLRRIYRDITERGGNLEGVISWFRRDVQPNYPLYTKSTRRYADLVVPTDRPIDIAVKAIASAVRSLAG